MSLQCIFPVRAFPFTVALCLSLLVGCATTSSMERDADIEESVTPGGTQGVAIEVNGTVWAALSGTSGHETEKPDALSWEIFRVPGKQPGRYRYVQHEGRDAVLALADGSGSMLRHRRNIQPANLGQLSFSWHVPAATPVANAALPTLEDVPVRIVLAFEGDRSRFSIKNSLLSELSQLLTGEPLPYATLIYSWSRVSPPGDVIFNDQTDRIRKLVVESGDAGYNQWRSYERDIRADFRKTFGEEPGALTSLAVFTEAEKDQGLLQAWYGPVMLQPMQVFGQGK